MHSEVLVPADLVGVMLSLLMITCVKTKRCASQLVSPGYGCLQNDCETNAAAGVPNAAHENTLTVSLYDQPHRKRVHVSDQLRHTRKRSTEIVSVSVIGIRSATLFFETRNKPTKACPDRELEG